MIKRFAKKQKHLAQVEWDFSLRQKVYDVLNEQLKQLPPNDINPEDVVIQGWNEWLEDLKVKQTSLSETERKKAFQLRQELIDEITMGLEAEIEVYDKAAEKFLEQYREEIEDFRRDLDRELDLGLIDQQQYQDRLRNFFQAVQKKTDMPKMPDKPNVEEERNRLMDQFLSGEISEQQYKEEMKKWSFLRGFCKKAQDFQGGFDGFFGGGDMIGQQTNFSTPNSEGEPGPQSEQGFEAARQQQLEKIRLKKLEEAKKKINDNSKKT